MRRRFSEQVVKNQANGAITRIAETKEDRETPGVLHLPPLMIVAVVVSLHGSRGLRAADRAQQQLREKIRQDGDPEQHQADLNQGAQINIGGRLGELVGNHARQGVTGREQRFAICGRVADDHGDGHRFAQRATEAEDDRTEKPFARIAQDREPGDFPARRAERVGRFTLQDRAPREGSRVIPM